MKKLDPESKTSKSKISKKENASIESFPVYSFYGTEHEKEWKCSQCQESFINKPFNQCPKDFGTLVSEENVQKTFNLYGKYEIRKPLGARDITKCLLAYDKEKEKDAIIQIFQGNDRKTHKRFLEAANRLKELDHENIYNVYDANSNKTYGTYYVGEFVPGVILKDLLEQKKRFKPEEILQITIAVLSGLEYAHKKEIYHCSLDLSKILVSKTEEGSYSAKVMDFGIATRNFDGLDWQGSPESDTRTLNVYGDSDAMSPEVIRGSKPTSASDIYSVGCYLYETLAGKKVFEREAELFTLFAHINDPPEGFDPELNIPEKLESIILKCLEKVPENRFSSASSLKMELQKLNL